jgi:hypothetical protein
MLATPKRTIRTKHKFAKANVIMETFNFMEGKDDDHVELFQRNKRHHRLINDNLCRNTRRFTFIIVAPFLTQGISVF